ncbi:MAG: hypothetical protein EOO42_21485, partial [Flavobacteriales bacterium]
MSSAGHGGIKMISGEWGHFNVEIYGNNGNLFVKANDTSQARNNIRGRIFLMNLGIGFHNVFGWNPLENGVDPNNPTSDGFPYNIFVENGNIYTGNLKPAGKAERTFIDTFSGYSNQPQLIQPLQIHPTGYDQTNIGNQRFVFQSRKPGSTANGNSSSPLIFAAWTQSNQTDQQYRIQNLPPKVIGAEVYDFINGESIGVLTKNLSNEIIIPNLKREPVYVK